MLVDSITLTIKAEDGGNGSASLLRNGMTAKGGPDGGNGGNGGEYLLPWLDQYYRLAGVSL